MRRNFWIELTLNLIRSIVIFSCDTTDIRGFIPKNNQQETYHYQDLYPFTMKKLSWLKTTTDHKNGLDFD